METDTTQSHGSGSPELEELKNFLAAHGKQLAVAAVVVVLAVSTAVYVINRKALAVEEASMALNNARMLQDLEKLIVDHPGTPSAPLALIMLAKGYFDSGDYDMASAKYMEFEQQYPKHMLFPAAIMGKLHCMEARLQIHEALEGFAAFQKDYPDSFLYSQAVFGQARCLEQIGRFDEARIVYENFIASGPSDELVYRAEDAMAALKRKENQSQSGGIKTADPMLPFPVIQPL